MSRMVIYETGHSGEYSWDGSVEFEQGRWPFRKVQHAPITHAATAEEVFAWLRKRYPDRVIAYDPTVTQRYSKDNE